VNINVNGQVRSCDAPANTRSVFVLRNDLGLCGVKLGCGEGHCGACTVLVDGRPVTTCDLPLWALEGKAVRTLEGLGTPEAPHPVQAAFLQEQAAQCGFCLSGILMTATALVEREAPPTEQEVRTALDQHLCRCGSHHRIVKAVMRAVAAVHA
jgi:nicotinate dehydrogenase subunit A